MAFWRLERLSFWSTGFASLFDWSSRELLEGYPFYLPQKKEGKERFIGSEVGDIKFVALCCRTLVLFRAFVGRSTKLSSTVTFFSFFFFYVWSNCEKETFGPCWHCSNQKKRLKERGVFFFRGVFEGGGGGGGICKGIRHGERLAKIKQKTRSIFVFVLSGENDRYVSRYENWEESVTPCSAFFVCLVGWLSRYCWLVYRPWLLLYTLRD